jgi:hypothetical protein
MMAKTKSKKATQTSKRGRKPGQKRCSEKGCRRLRVGVFPFCPGHSVPVKQDPIDVIVKVTSGELAELTTADLKLQNGVKEVTIFNLETEKVLRGHRDTLNARKISADNLNNKQERTQKNYDSVLKMIADKYGMDPKKLSWDSDTGVLRDLRVHEKKKE